MKIRESIHYELGEEQRAIKDTVQRFASIYLRPINREIGEDKTLWQDCIREMASLGILSVRIPHEYGGIGGDYITQISVIEEIALVSISIALATFCAHGVAQDAILKWGTKPQKELYLPLMCKGETLGAHTLNNLWERSETANIKFERSEHKTGWLLNGRSNAVLNASFADVFVVFSQGKEDTNLPFAFLIDRKRQGVKIDEPKAKPALYASGMGTLSFDDCFVNKEEALGTAKERSAMLSSISSIFRVYLSAVYIGLAQACLQVGVDYSKKREAFGRAICNYQAIQGLIADSSMEIELARTFLYRTGDTMSKEIPFEGQAMTIKRYSSELMVRIAENMFQIHGGYGFSDEFAIGHYMRDAAAASIIGGTLMLYREKAAQNILGLAEE